MTHADLIAALDTEMRRGKIAEADMRSPGEVIYGYCDSSERVYVNPKPMVVETLLHELIHRRWPTWSEETVNRKARRALYAMSDRDVAKWYRRYQAAVRRHKRPKKIEP